MKTIMSEQEERALIQQINVKRKFVADQIMSEMNQLKKKNGKPYKQLQRQLYRLMHAGEDHE